MINNYVVYHLHSDLSNGVTNIDSVTQFKDYVDRAAELGMKAMAFSEHGSVFEWLHKKEYIESKGMKYIHACEVYVTAFPKEKIRDNMHCVLIAKNYDGFKELNRMISKSFNRNDNHFYFTPRIYLDEFFNISNNIIITSACIGGLIAKSDEVIRQKILEFMSKHSDRCYLEIQHHKDKLQCEYNQKLIEYSNTYKIPLIAGTDTHALNLNHVKGRHILQISKGVKFAGEENWDLTFKSYEELVKAYEEQNSVSPEYYITAIENTNKMADMVEPFTLDRNTKYPKIYDNPLEAYKKAIIESCKNNKYIRGRYSQKEIVDSIKEELEVYKATKSIDFMMLEVFMRAWEKEHGIECGYGRGSVSGSFIAYLLGITQMDSKKFHLNFFRFMNPSRVTNADIDTDYSKNDRVKVKEFLLKDRMGLDNIRTSEIITFNTIALKGAIRDVCRALYKNEDFYSRLSPRWQKEYDCYIELCKAYNGYEMSEDLKNEIEKACGGDYIKIANEIIEMCDINEGAARQKYSDVFEYVDVVNGTIVSIGSHPSGVLVSDKNIEEDIGMCSLSTSPYPVSMLNMKELDALMYVKLDILGLDNIGLINDTCKMLNIERLTPDNVNLNDEKVWKSIRDDTTLIFQWESDSAQSYLKRFMSDKTIEIAKTHNKNFSYIKWFSFGNGLIRPGCASFRDDVANGDIIVTGFKELDDFLAITFGRVTMQEDIMQFLVKFCGYSDAESDTVRRGIAKKYGTEKFIDEIHDRFIDYSNKIYHVAKEKLEEIFPPIKQGILDASSYAFSWNHSDSYSCIGYICGYLRYYYPLEFLTVALNTFADNEEKSTKIVEYCNKVGILIKPIKFRHSKDVYTPDKEHNTIYKGISSVKFLNADVSKQLYDMREQDFPTFIDFLKVNPCNSKQTEILIKLDFFSEFGKSQKLLDVYEIFNKYGGKKQIKKENLDIDESLVLQYGTATEKMYKITDNNGLLKELCKSIQNKNIPISERIIAEKEYLGYIEYKNLNFPDSLYFVFEIKTYKDKCKPYVTLYSIKTGETIKTKVISANEYSVCPFKENNILNVWFDDKYKSKLIDGKWTKTNEKEKVMSHWEIMKS